MRQKAFIIGLSALAAALFAGCGKGDDDYATARSLMNSGKYSAAEEYFEKAAANNNSDAGFYVDAGLNDIELQKYSAAEENFRHALSLGDRIEDAYRGIGICCYEQGRYAEAIEAFDSAIAQVELSVGPAEYDILKYRGDCEDRLGRYEKALSTYNALIELGIDRTEQYLKEGAVYLALKDSESACKCFDKALEIRGNDVQVYFSIYNSCCDAGLTDTGMKYLSRALEVDGNSNQAHLWRGRIYYLMGNNSAALTELSYPLEDNDHEAALYAAFCYEAMGDYDSAVQLYYEELSRVNDPVMINYLAICLSAQGDYNKAWNVVHSAISQYPDCECIQQLRWNEIVLYERMGYYPSAYTHLLEYKELYPNDPAVKQELEFLLMKQS